MHVNFTIILYSGSKLAGSALLKVDIITGYVYDERGNFIGKWIYMLGSDIPIDLLEKGPIKNCTLILANYGGKKFYGPCFKVKTDKKEYVASGPDIREKLVLDPERNIVLHRIPHLYYNPKSRLLVKVDEAIMDDILYNVFGVYYIEEAYMKLIKVEKA